MPGVFLTTYIKYLQRAYVHAFIHLCQECSSLPYMLVLLCIAIHVYIKEITHHCVFAVGQPHD
jgi:hypothetical protein